MGRGDKKSLKGKRTMGSYGVTRLKRKPVKPRPAAAEKPAKAAPVADAEPKKKAKKTEKAEK